MRVLLLAVLFGQAVSSFGQSSSDKQVIIEGLHITASMLALVSTAPPRLAPDDSLAQLAYRRNRVRTVTLLQVNKDTQTDTIDYSELDRHGNITFFRPHFGQAYRQVFNRHQQLTEKVRYPFCCGELVQRFVCDPVARTTTSLTGPDLAHLATFQIARTTHRGDTTETESFLQDAPGLPKWQLRRITVRTFQAGKDTLRTDVVGYDAEQQVRSFESSYSITGNRHQIRETGGVSFGKVEPLRASASEAQQLLAASRHAHGRYLSGSRFTYNAQGALVRTHFIPSPNITSETAATTTSADGSTSITTRPISDTTSVRYVRTPQGWLQREEMWMPAHKSSVAGVASMPPRLSVTEYTYWPNGLRKTKAANLSASRYEYHYTYY
jgi:hypothetical protein